MHTKGWEDNWSIVNGDVELSQKLILVFEAYLNDLHEKGMAKSTINRHKSACHALGGYIVDQVFNYQIDTYEKAEKGEDILLRYLDECDGPLIHHDNEAWQREVDTTCRKLNKFIKNNRRLP